jgi:hypothetical protein
MLINTVAPTFRTLYSVFVSCLMDAHCATVCSLCDCVLIFLKCAQGSHDILIQGPKLVSGEGEASSLPASLSKDMIYY